ncbi:MAG: hypothetical protein JSU01_13910 [Bacteroidetes bacterium]|nr:hypothetical protein [Bacteroidota bacterium]
MKKLFLIAACFSVVLYACNKSGAKPYAAVSATIDGVDENFNTADSLGYKNTATVYSATVTAASNASSTADKLELYIANPSQLAPGTYALTTTWNPPYGPLIVYKLNGSTNSSDAYVVDYTGEHPAQITITAISNSNIQGTFSGVLVNAANNGTTKTITNGKFDVGAN